MDKVEIPLSKKKLILGIVGSFLFVVLGLCLFTIIAEQQTRFSPVFVKGVGITGILFFGATGIYGTRKVFDRKVGLIIDEYGIIDNTNASSVGLIKWSDIIEIKTEKVASTKFLLIYTINPEQYLDKAKGFKKKLMEGNNKMYSTPLSITSSTLKYKFEDLERIINERFNKEKLNA
ncbi:MAG: hypothetical protein LBQ22_05835 [Bacteroidales bacterium]|nr:hypothetical protein [Bacteroidales bacterium]